MMAYIQCFAYLMKNVKKCGIRAGTGIYMILDNGLEVGKGLNEGYTNWISNKAGVPTKNYTRLTNFVSLLELAVGRKSVMALGKGDIEGNIPGRLKMTKEEAIKLFMMADDVFELEESKKIDETRLRKCTINFLDTVFDKYFKMDIQKAIKPMHKISYKEMRKYETLNELCKSIMNMSQEYEKGCKSDALEFINSTYRKLLSKYSKDAMTEVDTMQKRAEKTANFKMQIRDMSRYSKSTNSRKA